MQAKRKCSYLQCKKPAEVECSCEGTPVALCAEHLALHIVHNISLEHHTKRIEAEPIDIDLLLSIIENTRKAQKLNQDEIIKDMQRRIKIITDEAYVNLEKFKRLSELLIEKVQNSILNRTNIDIKDLLIYLEDHREINEQMMKNFIISADMKTHFFSIIKDENVITINPLNGQHQTVVKLPEFIKYLEHNHTVEYQAFITASSDLLVVKNYSNRYNNDPKKLELFTYRTMNKYWEMHDPYEPKSDHNLICELYNEVLYVIESNHIHVYSLKNKTWELYDLDSKITDKYKRNLCLMIDSLNIFVYNDRMKECTIIDRNTFKCKRQIKFVLGMGFLVSSNEGKLYSIGEYQELFEIDCENTNLIRQVSNSNNTRFNNTTDHILPKQIDNAIYFMTNCKGIYMLDLVGLKITEKTITNL